MVRRFRTLNKLYAWLFGYFWIPCPRCGEMFGGHEMNPYAVEVVAGAQKVCCWRHPDDSETTLGRLHAH